MLSRIVRFVYDWRALLKPFIPIRRPVLLHLPGFKLYVRLDDWAIGARIAVRQTYEAHVTRVMRRLLKPGTVLVDIGANVGYYTMLAAAQVGPTGKVIALEPGQTNGRLMRMSIAANGFTNVVLHPYAVAHQNGTGRFWLDEDSNGHLLPAASPAAPAAAEVVPLVTLDSLLQDEPRIDIIKMDIEGSEGLALQGMRQLIQRHRPILFTEFSWQALPATSGISPEHYLDQLRALGYALLIIHRAGGLSPTPQSNAQIMQYRGKPGSLHHLDLLAYPCLPPR